MINNREIAAYTLDELKKAGATAAQCIVGNGKTDELNIDGGEFSLMRTLFNSSLTIKALIGNKKGTTSINRLEKDAIDEAIKSCMRSVENSVDDEAEIIAPFAGKQDFVTGAAEPDHEKLFDRLREYMDSVKTEYPKIILEQVIATYSNSERFYMNTNGSELSYKYGVYSFDSMFSAHDADKSSSFIGTDDSTITLDRAFIDLGMQRRLLAESEKQLDTVSIDEKFVGKLLITPACMASILMSILRNCVTDTVLIEGTSPWREMLGQKVAHDNITLSSVPLDDRIVCGERITADGYIAENYDIIKNGVLKSFALSQYGARKTGLERAKNTSFEIEMAAGDKSFDELVADAGDGLMLSRFSGGSPAVNGDFSGVAKNSFLIKNGSIVGAVSETMISGNLLDMINNCLGISSERICNGSTILPWALFDGITISGK